MPNTLRDDLGNPLLDDAGGILGDHAYAVNQNPAVQWETENVGRSWLMRNQILFDLEQNGNRFVREGNGLVFRIETTGTFDEEW